MTELRDIAEIVTEIWLSGKNDSPGFDFQECSTRQRWVARLLGIVKASNEQKIEEVINQLQGIYNQAGDLRTMERLLKDFLDEQRQALKSRIKEAQDE